MAFLRAIDGGYRLTEGPIAATGGELPVNLLVQEGGVTESIQMHLKEPLILQQQQQAILFSSASSQLNNGSNHHYYEEPGTIGQRQASGHLLLLFALLIMINLIVILGNILVILAVYATAKLQNVTNIFIVSLATADLLLGLLVLPYALTFEILDVWIFGESWCRGWLVTDVWISTASILSLCAISVDRYVAVTRPVKYRSIMTPHRARSIVAAVWLVSFLICCPPLLPQWNPSEATMEQPYLASSSLTSQSELHPSEVLKRPSTIQIDQQQTTATSQSSSSRLKRDISMVERRYNNRMAPDERLLLSPLKRPEMNKLEQVGRERTTAVVGKEETLTEEMHASDTTKSSAACLFKRVRLAQKEGLPSGLPPIEPPTSTPLSSYSFLYEEDLGSSSSNKAKAAFGPLVVIFSESSELVLVQAKRPEPKLDVDKPLVVAVAEPLVVARNNRRLTIGAAAFGATTIEEEGHSSITALSRLFVCQTNGAPNATNSDNENATTNTADEASETTKSSIRLTDNQARESFRISIVSLGCRCSYSYCCYSCESSNLFKFLCEVVQPVGHKLNPSSFKRTKRKLHQKERQQQRAQMNERRKRRRRQTRNWRSLGIEKDARLLCLGIRGQHRFRLKLGLEREEHLWLELELGQEVGGKQGEGKQANSRAIKWDAIQSVMKSSFFLQSKLKLAYPFNGKQLAWWPASEQTGSLLLLFSELLVPNTKNTSASTPTSRPTSTADSDGYGNAGADVGPLWLDKEKRRIELLTGSRWLFPSTRTLFTSAKVQTLDRLKVMEHEIVIFLICSRKDVKDEGNFMRTTILLLCNNEKLTSKQLNQLKSTITSDVLFANIGHFFQQLTGKRVNNSTQIASPTLNLILDWLELSATLQQPKDRLAADDNNDDKLSPLEQLKQKFAKADIGSKVFTLPKELEGRCRHPAELLSAQSIRNVVESPLQSQLELLDKRAKRQTDTIKTSGLSEASVGSLVAGRNGSNIANKSLSYSRETMNGRQFGRETSDNSGGNQSPELVGELSTATLFQRGQKSGCTLFNDKPYVIYSALGSFYIPMLIMIFFYSRIYLVASRAQKAVQRGYMTTKWPVASGSTGLHSLASGGGGGGSGSGGNGKGGKGSVERVTLRIHRREKNSGSRQTSATEASGSVVVCEGQTTPPLASPRSLLQKNPDQLMVSETTSTNTTKSEFVNSTQIGNIANLCQNNYRQSCLTDRKEDLGMAVNSCKVASKNSCQLLLDDDNDGYGDGIEIQPNQAKQSITDERKHEICKATSTNASKSTTTDSQTKDGFNFDEATLDSMSGEIARKVDLIAESNPNGPSSSIELDEGQQKQTSTIECRRCRRRVDGQQQHHNHQHHHHRHDNHQHLNHHHHHHHHHHRKGHQNSRMNSHKVRRNHKVREMSSEEPSCSEVRLHSTTRPNSTSSGCVSDGVSITISTTTPTTTTEPCNKALGRHGKCQLMHTSIAEEHSLSGSSELPLPGLESISNDDHHESELPIKVLVESGSTEVEEVALAQLSNPIERKTCRINSRDSEESVTINLVQITVSRFDGDDDEDDDNEDYSEERKEKLVTGAGGQRLVKYTTAISTVNQLEMEKHTEETLDMPGKCVTERSLSADLETAKGASLQQELDSVAFGRVDRSHSCGPTPTIIVNWNPNNRSTECQLTGDKRDLVSEETLNTALSEAAACDGMDQLASGTVTGRSSQLAGSQGSGLSLMASLPMAANQVRKQSLMLLTTLTAKSGQTLRRLSTVATHPMESLLNRSRSRDGCDSDGSLEEGEGGHKIENKKKKERKKKRKKPLKGGRGTRGSRRTIDDYLMAVAGIDSSSGEDMNVATDDDLDEDDVVDEENDDKDGNSDNSLSYSIDLDGKGNSIACSDGLVLKKGFAQETEAPSLDDEWRCNKLAGCQVDMEIPTAANKISRVSLTGQQESPVMPINKVDKLDSPRPASVLQRKGGYYERATSRTGMDSNKAVGVEKAVNGSIRPSEGDSKVPLMGLEYVRNPRRRGAKRTSRWHAKRLRAETKAAKTVAIIIGGFIFCWLPFFTAYLWRAIVCERPDCIPHSLLSLFIWLGYLNSAINPVIYGLFSADFRHAFKNIICRCHFRNTDDTVAVSALVDNIIKSIL